MDILLGLSIIPMLVALVALHEAGHLVAARCYQVKVLEFGLGMPPQACAWHLGHTTVHAAPTLLEGLQPKDWVRCVSRQTPQGQLVATRIDRERRPPPGLETVDADLLVHQGRVRQVAADQLVLADCVISLNWIPVGGYVRVAGDERPGVPHGLAGKKLTQRAVVTIAGVAVNLALALPLLVGAQWLLPQLDTIVVAAPTQHAGYHAGLRVGDQVVAINGEPVQRAKDVIDAAAALRGAPQVSWQISRNGQLRELRVDHRQTIGVRLGKAAGPKLSVTQAMATGVGSYATAARRIAELPRRFTQRGDEAPLAGPVATARAVSQVTQQAGAAAWLAAAALVSMSLGIINLLPLPPMDGFKLSLLAMEAVRRGKRLSPHTERNLNNAGFAALLTISAGVLVLEVGQLIF